MPTSLKMSSTLVFAEFVSATTCASISLAFLPIPSQILFTTELISEEIGSALNASISACAYAFSSAEKEEIAELSSLTLSAALALPSSSLSSSSSEYKPSIFAYVSVSSCWANSRASWIFAEFAIASSFSDVAVATNSLASAIFCSHSS